MFRNRGFVLIDNLAVLKEYRKRGIAKALFAAIKSWALERKLSLIKLKVYSNNEEAINFYRTRGFTSLTQELELKL